MAEIRDLSPTDASNNDASFGFPENMVPSSVNDNLRRILGALSRWYGDTNGTLVTAGTGSAYTLASPNRSLTTSYSDGLVMMFQAHTVCSSGASLAVDGKTAKTLMKSAATTVSSSDIIQDQIVFAVYESGIDAWQMLSPVAKAVPSGGADEQVIKSDGSGGAAYEDVTKIDTTDATNGGSNDLTSVDISGFNNQHNVLTVVLDQISTSGTSALAMQLGDSGGIETTGYSGRAHNAAGTVGTSSTYYALCADQAILAGDNFFGTITICRITSSVVVVSWVISNNTGDVFHGSGRKSLSGDLTTVRLTTAGGSDTFDAGYVVGFYQ